VDKLMVGEPRQFIATGAYSNGYIFDISSQVDWVSSNTNKATVSSGGLVTPLAAGTTAIKASLSGVNSTSVTLMVTAPEPILTSILINSPLLDLTIGATQQFNAVGIFSDGSFSDITYLVNWASSNTAVATISSSILTPNTGLAKYLSAGKTNITASLLGVTTSVKLTVNPTPVVTPTITVTKTVIAQ
jgi:hypothetical protein